MAHQRLAEGVDAVVCESLSVHTKRCHLEMNIPQCLNISFSLLTIPLTVMLFRDIFGNLSG